MKGIASNNSPGALKKNNGQNNKRANLFCLKYIPKSRQNEKQDLLLIQLYHGVDKYGLAASWLSGQYLNLLCSYL
jgi:hypothetical protein